jgi:hypothetical protein
MQYIDALVSVGYSSGEETDFISESLEPTVEFVTLDYKNFRWGAANGDEVKEGEAPGKLVRSLSLVRTIYHLASIPTDVLDLVGSVNDTAYASTLLGLTFPAETMLFSPPSMDRTITTAGTKGWNLAMRWMYKPETWNKFWNARANPAAYQRMYTVDPGTVYNSYPLEDHSNLLY